MNREWKNYTTQDKSQKNIYIQKADKNTTCLHRMIHTKTTACVGATATPLIEFQNVKETSYIYTVSTLLWYS